jgi:hypothetical protein
MAPVEQWELEQWSIPRMSVLLPLNETELQQIVSHTLGLSEEDAAEHLRGLLGDSEQAVRFISEFSERRMAMKTGQKMDFSGTDEKRQSTSKTYAPPTYAPPAYPPPGADHQANGAAAKMDGKAQPAFPQTRNNLAVAASRHHTNAVIEAGKVRAKDEVRSRALPCVCENLSLISG